MSESRVSNEIGGLLTFSYNLDKLLTALTRYFDAK